MVVKMMTLFHKVLPWEDYYKTYVLCIYTCILFKHTERSSDYEK